MTKLNKNTLDAAIVAFIRSLSAAQCLELAGALGYAADYRGPSARRFDDFQAESAGIGESAVSFTNEEIHGHLDKSGKALRSGSKLFFELAYKAQDKSDIGRWPPDVDSAMKRVCGVD
jgi:hypothetical protein